MRARRIAPSTRRAATALAAFAASLALFAGCRQILGIEELTYDPVLDETSLTCDRYCGLIMSLCTGANSQYTSDEACYGVCETFTAGSLDDSEGNSLGCRIAVLAAATGGAELSECAAAGPSGNDVCGTPCDAYCSQIAAVCPDTFESIGDCAVECQDLSTCGTYTANPEDATPDNPSVECRIYHLSVAARDGLFDDNGDPTTAQTVHCPHASGETECLKDSGIACP